MQVKVKKLDPRAVVPQYAKAGDAGLDLTAIEIQVDEYTNLVCKTGLAFEIPEGYVGLIYPRSSNCKTDYYLTNHVGVVDSGYRGEVMLKFRSLISYVHPSVQQGLHQLPDYKVGDRVGQLIIMPYPQIELVEADELSTTERGTGGYGHTGK